MISFQWNDFIPVEWFHSIGIKKNPIGYFLQCRISTNSSRMILFQWNDFIPVELFHSSGMISFHWNHSIPEDVVILCCLSNVGDLKMLWRIRHLQLHTIKCWMKQQHSSVWLTVVVDTYLSLLSCSTEIEFLVFLCIFSRCYIVGSSMYLTERNLLFF